MKSGIMFDTHLDKWEFIRYAEERRLRRRLNHRRKLTGDTRIDFLVGQFVARSRICANSSARSDSPR